MAKHDDLLQEGPREAPEPETAEQRSKRMRGAGAVGGIALGGLAVLAKVGVLAKVALWIFVWHGLWMLGGWIAGAVLIGFLVVMLVLHLRGS